MNTETFQRRPSLRSAPGRSRSRSKSQSRSHSKQRRPSLGSRKNSSISFITFKNNYDPSAITPVLAPTSSNSLPPLSPSLMPIGSSASANYTASQNTIDTDIPTITATLDHTLPMGYFKQDLLSVLKNLRVSKWHRLPPHVSPDIKLTKISGALTNAIYKVDPPSVVILKNLNLHNIHFPSLLLRIYGPNVESLIDREYELKVLVRLSKQNIGPRLFGCFTNGRIEQFLDNATTLTRKDIHDKKTSARIARRMKELHSGIRLSKFEKDLGPTVWRTIIKWLNHIEDSIAKGTLKLNEQELFQMDFQSFKKVVFKYQKWLFDRYGSLKNLNNSLVFCHNDTQYGNLLFTSQIKKIPKTPSLTPMDSNTSIESISQASLSTNFSNLSLDNLRDIKPSIQEKKQDRNLVVIDFEYSGPNVPSYDIVNHFCEWMSNYDHPTYNYAVFHKDYPNLDAQLNLIYSYILFNSEQTSDINKLEKQAKELFNDCIAWRPAVGINWALWAIIQNGENSVSTDAIVEMGPNGETYKIVKDDLGNDENVLESDDNEEDLDKHSENDENGGSADTDNFEYLKYCQEKLGCCFGDLLQFELINQDDLKDLSKVKYLPAEFYDI